MNEDQAKTVAGILGGEARPTGGNRWVVRFDTRGGEIVVISNECVVEYASEEAYRGDREMQTIYLKP